MKSKTLATWLALSLGPLGGHRFYLHGWQDRLGWLLCIPTALGAWGLWRVQAHGLDDMLSWWLLPIFGFSYAACALNAIVIGLSEPAHWNALHNPRAPAEHPSGKTSWNTIFGVVLSLIIGATVLLSSIVYSFQRYFEYQIELAHQLVNEDSD